MPHTPPGLILPTSVFWSAGQYTDVTLSSENDPLTLMALALILSSHNKPMFWSCGPWSSHSNSWQPRCFVVADWSFLCQQSTHAQKQINKQANASTGKFQTQNFLHNR